jgi:hypothetical protein
LSTSSPGAIPEGVEAWKRRIIVVATCMPPSERDPAAC